MFRLLVLSTFDDVFSDLLRDFLLEKGLCLLFPIKILYLCAVIEPQRRNNSLIFLLKRRLLRRCLLFESRKFICYMKIRQLKVSTEGVCSTVSLSARAKCGCNHIPWRGFSKVAYPYSRQCESLKQDKLNW